MKLSPSNYAFLLLFYVANDAVVAFSASRIGGRCKTSTTSTQLMETPKKKSPFNSISVPAILSIGIIGASILFPSDNALADEIGREVEAPTLFTGETVLVRHLKVE